jgi:excisionase family DNA binding protein
MAILIADTIAHIVYKLKDQLVRALIQHESFVIHLEDTHLHPELADCTIPCEFDQSTRRVEKIKEQVEQYSLFDPSLLDYIEQVDQEIGNIADRFLGWAHRKMISTREAMDKFGRSQSTIYRWIRSGKLQAVKERGRWLISA